jgi:hypothetical protein
VQNLNKIGTVVFKSSINRITKKKLNICFLQKLLEEKIEKKMVDKCILVFTIVCTRKPYLHPCGRQDIYNF